MAHRSVTTGERRKFTSEAVMTRLRWLWQVIRQLLRPSAWQPPGRPTPEDIGPGMPRADRRRRVR